MHTQFAMTEAVFWFTRNTVTFYKWKINYCMYVCVCVCVCVCLWFELQLLVIGDCQRHLIPLQPS